jgi:hypothetical protein
LGVSGVTIAGVSPSVVVVCAEAWIEKALTSAIARMVFFIDVSSWPDVFPPVPFKTRAAE